MMPLKKNSKKKINLKSFSEKNEDYSHDPFVTKKMRMAEEDFKRYGITRELIEKLIKIF